jgi:hypothetical protein
MAPEDPIDREHARLVAEQQALLKEHEWLEAHPYAAAEHREHSRKLRAHITALHAHLVTLRAKP